MPEVSANNGSQPPALKKKAKVLVVAGVVLLAAGGAMNHYLGSAPVLAMIVLGIGLCSLLLGGMGLLLGKKTESP